MSSVKDLLRGDVVDGSGTANYVSKWSDADTITNSVIYDDGTNVSIGTSNVSGKLNVALAGDSNGNVGSWSSNQTVFSRGGTVFSPGIGFSVDTTSSTSTISSLYPANSWYDLQLRASNITFFGGGGVESMRIDSTGNVGIGTSSPSRNLVVQNSNSVSLISVVSSPDTTAYLLLGDTDSDAQGRLQYNNSEDSLQLYTSGSERMRITSGGDFLIGTTTLPFSGRIFSVKATGKVAGSFYRVTTDPTDAVAEFNSNIGATPAVKCVIYADGDIENTNNSYGALSDVKLKENITDATPKLGDLLKVKVRNYNLIGEETKQLGVVAQELEEVFPSLIKEVKDYEEVEVTDEEGNVTTERVETGTTTKSVKYSVFVPMLIKAMQDQQEIIEGLKLRIEILENK